MYMHTKQGVQRVTLLGHIGCLLLIYLKPSEVYEIFTKLIENTNKIKKNAVQKNRLRWHIPKDEFDLGQLISAFLGNYVKQPANKKLLKHFYEQDIKLDLILHSLFNSLL